MKFPFVSRKRYEAEVTHEIEIALKLCDEYKAKIDKLNAEITRLKSPNIPETMKGKQEATDRTS